MGCAMDCRESRQRGGMALVASSAQDCQRLPRQLRRVVLRTAVARSDAGEDAAVDALADGGEAEDRKRHVEIPVRDAAAPGAAAISFEIFFLGRNSTRRKVDPRERAPARSRRMPQE